MAQDTRPGANGVATQNLITCGTTAVQLDTAANVLKDRYWVEILNTDATNAVYIGFTSGVKSASTGMGRIIAAGAVWQLAVPQSVSLWAIAAAGTPVVLLTQIE